MALQLSTAQRNAILDALETEAGTAPILRIRTGTVPANVATADSGTVLVSITLPSDWLAAASSASKAKSGTWSGTASATGTAGHWRLYKSNGTTVCWQGTCGAGSGDLSLDSVSITSGQTITISAASLAAANS